MKVWLLGMVAPEDFFGTACRANVVALPLGPQGTRRNQCALARPRAIAVRS